MRAALTSGLLTAVCAVLAGCVIAACSSPSSATSAGGTGDAPPIPLAGSASSASATWAALPMGYLGDPVNTFWQLVTVTGGSSHWTLATPPGVASNGGLAVTAGSSGSALAGFEPSQDLVFSPLAQSADGGATWSTGVLPGGLAPVPDSLASAGGTQLGLLASGGGRVVESADDLASWRTLVTERRIAQETSRSGCAVTRLTAVALVNLGSGGAPVPMVGTSCASGDRLGIFVLVGGTWVGVGPRAQGSTRASTAPVQVVRLVATSTGAVALVSTGSGPGTRLYGLWGTGTGTGATWRWTVTPALGLGSRRLSASGITPGGRLVVTAAGSGVVAWVVSPPVTPSPSAASPPSAASAQSPVGWQTLAAPPQGTAAVVPTPAGGLDALVVRQSTLDVDSLVGQRWQQAQVLEVPIQYGSSS